MFIDFFTAEDFDKVYAGTVLTRADRQSAADLANQKLAKEGLIIHGKLDKNRHPSNWWTTLDGDVHEGILINIKEIKKCEHPASKVKMKTPGGGSGISSGGIYREVIKGEYYYECECGANVVADTFKEI